MGVTYVSGIFITITDLIIGDIMDTIMESLLQLSQRGGIILRIGIRRYEVGLCPRTGAVENGLVWWGIAGNRLKPSRGMNSFNKHPNIYRILRSTSMLPCMPQT
jgi:hypothetical protein